MKRIKNKLTNNLVKIMKIIGGTINNKKVHKCKNNEKSENFKRKNKTKHECMYEKI